MKTNIKATGLELTPDVRAHVERVCATLEKFSDISSDALMCDVEVAKTTDHHIQGNIFRAEVNFSGAGEFLRAEAVNDSLSSALDEVRDELKRSLSHHKHKKQSLLRRTGARIKDFLRFGRGS